MSTQKAKFELFRRLQELGFTYEESVSLRRIEMTLQRWAEQECGDGNDFCSWSIERDEATNKPYRCVYPHTGKIHRYPIADREAGALRRLAVIVNRRNNRVNLPIHVPNDPKGAFIQSNPATAGLELIPYHQGDCRGCMLYLVPRSTLCDASGKVVLPIESYYTRGLAVCA